MGRYKWRLARHLITRAADEASVKHGEKWFMSLRPNEPPPVNGSGEGENSENGWMPHFASLISSHVRDTF